MAGINFTDEREYAPKLKFKNNGVLDTAISSADFKVGDTVLADSASYQIIQVALELAFEAGKWEGQVELEEHYDRSQFTEAFLEAAYSRKNAMPMKEPSTGRTVTVNLRSDKWREGVRKSAREYVDKAMLFVVQHFR